MNMEKVWAIYFSVIIIIGGVLLLFIIISSALTKSNYIIWNIRIILLLSFMENFRHFLLFQLKQAIQTEKKLQMFNP